MTELPPRGTDAVAFDPSFIGRGFCWPMEVDHTGSIRLAETTEDIEAAIRIILLTAPGERVMRPEFGCRIWEMLFEPITPNLLGMISAAVRDALAQWEPRIDVVSVVPKAENPDNGLVSVVITYLVRTTNNQRNLVFPFYVIPHDAE
ncbi:MAG TPA: GPW/gp25 family protein [Jatrophihabitans sp.]|nr:GPW/gp25 family protein [Jatrophihabitans sp.]